MHSTTLADVLSEHARGRPQGTATVCGDHRATWPELEHRVARLATVLAERGVGEGERVLWFAQNCHRLLEGLLACAQLGAIFVPANWRSSADELAFLLDDATPAVVLWQAEELGDVVAKARDASEHAATWIEHTTEYDGLVAAATPHGGPSPALPSDSVLMMYTAAFAGRPRGALLRHDGLVHQGLVTALVQRIDGDYTYLNCGPLFHMATFMTTLATFVLGGNNVFTPRSEPAEIARLVQDEGCDGAFLMWPTAKGIADLDEAYDLSSLKTMKMGIEGFDELISDERTPWIRRPGGYGQTEIAGIATWAAFGDGGGMAGRAAPGVQVRIVDPGGRGVPAGETGEIVVRGITVMNGYWGDDEETSRRQRDGWHHTADLGRRTETGTVEFVGPMTRIIKSAAENIYPAEVEGCLVQHPAVREVAVIGVPDPEWGQNVHAIVVLHPGNDVDADELIGFAKERIASYKKPKGVTFVDALPRTSGGQVDRDALDATHGGGGYPSH